MLKSFKSWIEGKFFTNPKAIGKITFLMILTLTMTLSFSEYQLRITDEQNQVDSRLIEVEKNFLLTLNDAVHAGRTLAYLTKNHDITQDFEEVGRQILENNPFVDVIQLLDSGKVIANYPSKGNEAILGYDNLQNGQRSKEAHESILREEMFFAGPLMLMQGKMGIIGRLPLFKDGQFTGFTSVIIFLDTLLDAANIKNPSGSLFYIQLSKINPNSGVLEQFSPEPTDLKELSNIKASTFIGSGNWNITVNLKKSTSLWRTIPSTILRIIFSIGMGIAAWNFSRQPSLLSQKVKEQSKIILESNERFEYATKATSDIIWDWDLLSNRVYRTDLFLEKFGYSNFPETNTAGFWTSIIHPDDQEQVDKNIKSVLASKDTLWEHEFRIQKLDQEYAYVREKGYIIRNEENIAIRMIGATEDITKRKISELEVAKEKEKLENVIRGTEAGTWEWNIQTGDSLFNETGAKIIGYELSELQPSSIDTWRSLIYPEDLERSIKALELHFSGKRDFYESEYRIKHKDQTCVWVLGRGKVSSWTDDGKPLMMFGTHMDITEKKAQEETLLIANQKLTNANEELQVFATLASHDIREPLRMISSFMALLQKKYGATLEPKANQYIHYAIDGAQRLTFLINDLLEYSKTGFDEENAEFIETKKLIEEILPLKRRLIYEKKAKIILGNLPDIRGVKTPIRTLFRNLLGNALLFTRAGVEPVIRIEGFEKEEFWEFLVGDNGIGIEPQHLNHIFGILNKVNLLDDSKRTGMGLSISKKIVEQHGGTIWVNSTPSEGSKFYFTLKKPYKLPH